MREVHELLEMVSDLSDRIAVFSGKVRAFFYVVVLSGYSCLVCGGELDMIREGLCRCQGCRRQFDPTTEFQACPHCEGRLALRIRRYQCTRCAKDVASGFLFDGRAFDAQYFRQKMAECRERGRQRRQHRRWECTMPHSEGIRPEAIDLSSVSGLLDALNNLTGQASPEFVQEVRSRFDLERYERHVLSHVGSDPVALEDIPPIGPPGRIERIWAFIAVIFLSHMGEVLVQQEGESIMVTKNETYRKGQELLGDAETVDKIEGPLGRVET